CLDAKTGQVYWKHSYGSNARGSPVFADGKIFVPDVNSNFHILKPHPNRCEVLHEEYLPPPEGQTADVEINGSPAVANGRVYFASNDEFYCIGNKGAQPAPEPIIQQPTTKSTGKIAHVQVLPADLVMHPGGKATFHVRFFDEYGEPVTAKDLLPATWSLPAPKPPPGAKTNPPPLDGEIQATSDGAVLTVSAKKSSQQGYVEVKVGDGVGRARVRVAPVLPYFQDFEKVPDGAVPGGWVNAQGKFLVKTVAGEKVLAKVNDKASPLIAKGNAYITMPTTANYTIEADIMGQAAQNSLPKMGVVASRYTLYLEGNEGKLRLNSWEAIPRVDKTVPFAMEPGTWYRFKLSVETLGGKTSIKGKVWPRAAAEPEAWLVLHDPRPNTEGSAALYGYVTGNTADGVLGTEIYYDNVRITPHREP
ncbi:MAG: PQQ-like beta-propeller repeat protein, partial [Gemmataceae bacterium]|nr:PQQ-like beta-propeller repeat protein [Gemmataceae bacterium]